MFFLFSVVALSQTASLYSSSGLMKEVHIFLRERLFILNLSARSKLSLVQAVAVMLLICSSQLQFSENVSPRCLCDDVSVMAVPFM